MAICHCAIHQLTSDPFSHPIKPHMSNFVRHILIPNQGIGSSITHIHNLPNEVLFNIFLKCCEELDLKDPDLEWNSPEPRRYPVIHTARAVCRKWRHLIEYYDHNAYNKRFFWYTTSDLSVVEDESRSDSAKRLSEFKRSLGTSQNSDIWLIFYLPWDSKDVTELSEVDAALLALAVRCVGFIIPHQEQIVHYEVYARQPQFLSYLLDLLTFRMKCMYRHPTIVFQNLLLPLSEILSATSIIPSRLLNNPMTTIPLSAYTAHLKHFDLTKHDLSWTDSNLMKFPFSITNLTIPPVNLLKAGGFFNAIGSYLNSLNIVKSKKMMVIDWSNRSDDEELESPKACIAFQKLLYLRISSTSDSWAEYFLKHTMTPCLESVNLHELSKISLTNSNSQPSSDTFSQCLDYPNLQRLHVDGVQLSQNSVFCITHFMRRNIRDLQFELSVLWGKLILEHPLKPIRLERLGIGKVPLSNWKMVLDILSSLNLNLLQELVIDASELYECRILPHYPRGPPFDFHRSINGSLDSLIKLPHLKSISFWGGIPRDINFLKFILNCIDTTSLTTLQIDLSHYLASYSADNDVFYGPASSVNQMPSIVSLNISLSSDGLNNHYLLTRLLCFASRLQRLTLEVRDRENVSSKNASIESIMKLFKVLSIHGYLALYLSSLRAEIEVNTGGEKDFLGQVGEIISGCLEYRHRCGAVHLGLCELSFIKDSDENPFNNPSNTIYRVINIILEHVPEKQKHLFDQRFDPFIASGSISSEPSVSIF